MRAEPIKAAGVIPAKQFDTLKLGTLRAAAIEMFGPPSGGQMMTIAQKTVGGNNQEAIADGYVREDMAITAFSS